MLPDLVEKQGGLPSMIQREAKNNPFMMQIEMTPL